MSRGQQKTVGQRLGLLTGGGLILGGVLGWAWSLFQAPGKPSTPPVEIPRPPQPQSVDPSTTVPQPAETLEASVEVDVNPGERAVVEHESLEPADAEPADAEPADAEPADAVTDLAEQAPVTTPAPAVSGRTEPVAVPDAVKAIRAAAAAARERLEAPARALPDAAAPAADTED